MYCQKLLIKSEFKSDKSPVSFSLPFSRGTFKRTMAIKAITSTGNTLFPEFDILSRWDDGTIRWVKFYCELNTNTDSNINLYLIPKSECIQSRNIISFSENLEYLTIKNFQCEFQISKTNLSSLIIASYGSNQNSTLGYLELTDQHGEIQSSVINSFDYTNNNFRMSVYIEGYFYHKAEAEGLKFQITLEFFSSENYYSTSVTIHNNNRAIHKGGFWDLGDPGSIYFKQLKWIQKNNWTSNAKITCDIENRDIETSSYGIREFDLVQYSSGGKRWNHKIHVNKDNEVPLRRKGFQLYQTKQLKQEGKRANPFVELLGENGYTLQAYQRKFWQNFPSSISFKDKTLEISLFPPDCSGLYEMQGGESKTQICIFGICSSFTSMLQIIKPTRLIASPEMYSESKALPWFSANKHMKLDRIVKNCIEGKFNFFNKRESADEYGWRNFGDIWADHETEEHNNSFTLVSHYNNQYDPIYGFVRQYFLSGDDRWLELMNDLASHVIDIDIYKTDLDREEYNHGLFWHTDHYVDAITASHRSFSKRHLDTEHVAQSGGGPGAEHCYTSGLLFQYYLTGDIKYRETVLKMSNWISVLFHGRNGVLERIHKLVTKDFRLIQKIRNGEEHYGHEFPFTRGTGNFINALIDSHELEPNGNKLKLCSSIIKSTISPADNISSRSLDDPEENWSYLVCLQSIAKFISKKIELGAFDNDFSYAFKSFFHYVDWMVDNEYFYLDFPENLEYPNSTWIAQEIRKAHLFFVAAKLAPANDDKKYIQAGAKFLDYTIKELSDPTRTKNTRILSILLQSYGPESDYLIPFKIPINIRQKIENLVIDPHPRILVRNILAKSATDILRNLCTLSIRKELKWLRLRLNLR